MIRRATADDAPTMAVLGPAFHSAIACADPLAPEAYEHMLRVYLTDPSIAFFVLEIEGYIMGGIGAFCMPFLWHPSVKHCVEMGFFIAEPFRGQGHAKGLMDALEGWAKEQGASTVLMAVPENNEILAGALERRGYAFYEATFRKEI